MFYQIIYVVDTRCVRSIAKLISFDKTFNLQNSEFFSNSLKKISDHAQGKARFLISTLIVFFIKILAVFFMYSRLSILGNFYTHWMAEWTEIQLIYDWLYLFCAWDTGFYVQIAMNWYFHPAYAFFPAYPSLIRIFSYAIGDEWLSATLLSFVLGIGCIPTFQILAEEYHTKKNAFISTMLMAFFPYIFLFTTIAYTESLFLLTTILSWYLYKKEKLIQSSIAVAIASLTKLYGLFIIIPIFIDILHNRTFRKIPYYSFPILTFFSWLFYLFKTTGDWMIFMRSQSYWINLGMEFNWINSYLKPILSFNIWQIPKPDYMLIAFVAFLGYLIFNTLRLDSKLGIYSIFMYFSLLFFGNFYSMPRFFSFIFPIWLNSKLKNLFVLFIILPFFILISLLIWQHFLLGQWIA